MENETNTLHLSNFVQITYATNIQANKQKKNYKIFTP